MVREGHLVHLAQVETLVNAADQARRADRACQVQRATAEKMVSMVPRARVAIQDVPANQGDPACQDQKVTQEPPELLANAEVRA